jgi:Cu2+-exporting ATPase
LNTVDIVVFDKTGTLTIEQPQVHRVHSFGRYSEDQLLAIAASGEQRQSHPIAKAIQHEANRRKLQLHDIADVQYEIGHGLRVTIDGQDILVGSDRFMTMKQVQLTEQARNIQASSRQRGSSIVLLAIDSEICGVVELDAAVRPEAREVVQSLRQLGKEIHIISGDQEQPTQELAKSLGVDHYFANTLPGHKAKLVEQLQKQGRRVCFVGDGINDSIALKQADVSVSLRGASTIAIDTAQVILMDGKLTHLAAMFELAKEYEGNTRRSFLMTLLPGAVNIGSALFLSTGVILSVILDRVGQLSGVVNGGLPLFRQRNAHEVSEQVESGMTDKNVI